MAPGAKQRRRAREKRLEAEGHGAGGQEAPPGPGKAERAVAGDGRPLKKRLEAEGDDGDNEPPLEDTEDIPPMPPPSKKHKGEKAWKAVQLDMDIMREFEAQGGLFFEEADDDIAITYSDGTTEVAAQHSSKKSQKRQKASKSDENSGNAAVGKEVVENNTGDVELPAWAPFDLHPELMRGLSRLGFSSPTEVQRRCLEPAIRHRKDIVGAAETGSGKTLAFGLPILHHTLQTLDMKVFSADVEGGLDAALKAVGQREGGPRALVILPTRELAVQVQSHINAAASHIVVRAECVVGGISVLKQLRLLRRKPFVVVGTPGRLHALLGLGRTAPEDCCEWLRDGIADLRHLVLDEADRLVESGHFKELDAILAHIYSKAERTAQLQTFVFSATLTLDPRSNYQRLRDGNDGGKVGQLMRRLRFREARSVHTVDLTQPEEVSGGASASSAGAKNDGDGAAAAASAAAAPAAKPGRSGRLPEKLQLLEAICSDDKDKEGILAMYLLRRYRWSAPTGPASTLLSVTEKEEASAALAGAVGGRVVLFVNAISGVHRLTSVLSLLLESPSASKVLNRVRMGNKKQDSPGLSVDVLGLHSQMRQKDRLKRMERFRSLKHAVLVCTDIAARGLDVPEVAAVVHYQAPRGAEVFIHRSGRTARAGRSGESVSFVSPSDNRTWEKVYRASGTTKDQLSAIDISANELNAAREAVRLSVELEQKCHTEYRKNGDKTWLRRTADEADLELSDDEGDGEEGRAPAMRQQLWGLYQQLQQRIRRPPRRSSAGAMPGKPGKKKGKRRRL